MQKLKTVTSLESILEAWDLYANRKFEAIVSHEEYSHSPSKDLRDLARLGQLEISRSTTDPEGELFAPLVQAMRQYWKGHYSDACALLGQWLETREYHTAMILDRFLECAFLCDQYRPAFQILNKFIKIPYYRDRLADDIVRSAHHAGLDKEAVGLYRDLAGSIRDQSVHQKAALSMVKLGLFRDAEKLLIKLFEKITGKKYGYSEDQFDALRSKYSERASTIEKQKRASSEDVMELGLAYLFSSRYDEALRLFETLKKKSASAA